MIVLPFPPASLSGHNTGSRWGKKPIVKSYRFRAHTATMDAMPSDLPEKGDIRVHFRFIPPDRRGDRVNYPNRLKPLIDGIADALGVNDKRFLPSYEFCAPEKPGRVEVEFIPDKPETVDSAGCDHVCGCAMKESGPTQRYQRCTGPDHEPSDVETI